MKEPDRDAPTPVWLWYLARHHPVVLLVTLSLAAALVATVVLDQWLVALAVVGLTGLWFSTLFRRSR